MNEAQELFSRLERRMWEQSSRIIMLEHQVDMKDRLLAEKDKEISELRAASEPADSKEGE